MIDDTCTCCSENGFHFYYYDNTYLWKICEVCADIIFHKKVPFADRAKLYSYMRKEFNK